jgi:hypothetical protein
VAKETGDFGECNAALAELGRDGVPDAVEGDVLGQTSTIARPFKGLPDVLDGLPEIGDYGTCRQGPQVRQEGIADRYARPPLAILPASGRINLMNLASQSTWNVVSSRMALGRAAVSNASSKNIASCGVRAALSNVAASFMDRMRSCASPSGASPTTTWARWLTVGYDTAEYAPDRWNQKAYKTIVHDVAPAEVYGRYPASVEVVADIAATIRALNAGLSVAPARLEQGWYAPVRRSLSTTSRVTSYWQCHSRCRARSTSSGGRSPTMGCSSATSAATRS